MPASSVAAASPIKVQGMGHNTSPDLLAVEEPLEIRLGFGPPEAREQRSLSVTMRTPGHDHELVLGFLLTEGIIRSRQEFTHLEYCQDVRKPEEAGNVIRVELVPEAHPDWDKLARHFYTGSSCGVCGKSSIEAVHQQACAPLPLATPAVSATLIHELPKKLRAAQNVFEHTGGLHATAIFNTAGELLLLREDIGRHNALDKAIGALQNNPELSPGNCIALVSGRAGFELVQKCVVAGLPILAAVGAPSSLAVSLAQESGLSLLGFVRQQRFNIYTGKQRINFSPHEA